MTMNHKINYQYYIQYYCIGTIIFPMNPEGNKVIFTCVIKNIWVIVSQFRDYKSQRHIEQRGSFGPFELVHENSNSIKAFENTLL